MGQTRDLKRLRPLTPNSDHLHLYLGAIRQRIVVDLPCRADVLIREGGQPGLANVVAIALIRNADRDQAQLFSARPSPLQEPLQVPKGDLKLLPGLARQDTGFGVSTVNRAGKEHAVQLDKLK